MCLRPEFVNVILCFFFKQKTAYEMRISDWSSDMCSSDLLDYAEVAKGLEEKLRGRFMNPKKIIYKLKHDQGPLKAGSKVAEGFVDYGWKLKIGRASCRERVCKYV